ncbi:MAG: hypothetical protein JOS17DRAFT_266133 [Linnemannia elongata]|nr:MAG: hypothetical protein JOS17DRAFT_266133 [Linnemannia elongata]
MIFFCSFQANLSLFPLFFFVAFSSLFSHSYPTPKHAHHHSRLCHAPLLCHSSTHSHVLSTMRQGHQPALLFSPMTMILMISCFVIASPLFFLDKSRCL